MPHKLLKDPVLDLSIPESSVPSGVPGTFETFNVYWMNDYICKNPVAHCFPNFAVYIYYLKMF